MVIIALEKTKILVKRPLTLEYYNSVRFGKEQHLVKLDLMGTMKERELTQDCVEKAVDVKLLMTQVIFYFVFLSFIREPYIYNFYL